MANQPQPKPSSSRRMRETCAAAIMLTLCWIPLTAAYAQAPATSFSQLLEKQMRQVFETVCKYVEQHPEAEDVDSAYRWVFQLALDYLGDTATDSRWLHYVQMLLMTNEFAFRD